MMLLFNNACKRKTVETYYFNCKIDGQYFEPSKKLSLGYYPLTAKLLYDNTQLRLHADNDRKTVDIFIFSLDSSSIQNKNYQFGKIGTTKTVAYFNSILTDSIYNYGKINIAQLDKQNMIVEGNFYFDAYNATLNDTIHITDGKFKLKYTLH
jgi:hypothetical protein